MITDEDTTKIVNRVVEANKLLFYDKSEMDHKFDGMRKDFSDLQTSVQSFAIDTKNNADEIKIVNSRVTSHEAWNKQTSLKIGLDNNS